MKKLKFLILVIGILICNISCKSHSIKTHEVKTFITSDSLAFIYLLPKNKFGFISYGGESPFSYKHNKNITKGHIDGPSFIINEHGTGTYSIGNNNVVLEFKKPEHAVENVTNKKIETKRETDSISIKLIMKSYIYDDEKDTVGYGTWIKSRDGKIDIRTLFENHITFNLNKKQLPLEIIINGNYTLKIKKKYNQEFTIFLNDFKMFTSNAIENKTFEFDKLLKLKTE
jgi:hypothetical protein